MISFLPNLGLGRSASGRRPPGRERDHLPGRVRHLQHLPADADVPDADARHRASGWHSGQSPRGTACSRFWTASRSFRCRATADDPRARGRADPGARRNAVVQRRPTGPGRRDAGRRPGEPRGSSAPRGRARRPWWPRRAAVRPQQRVDLDRRGGLRRIDPNDLRRAVALVPDDGFLFSATVRENISYARPDATLEKRWSSPPGGPRSIRSWIAPTGYDTLVGERGLTLSGGQRQRARRSPGR